MNINTTNFINEFVPQLVNETSQTNNVNQGIAVGEPHPQSPMSMGQRAITASFYYIAAMAMNSLNANQAQQNFRVKSYHTDELGMTHVKMEQVVNGLRVYGQEVITHVDNNGTVQSMTGNWNAEMLETPVASTRPSLSQESAIGRVRNHYRGSFSSPSTELLMYPTDKGMRMAYKVDFFDATAPARMTYFVDARNGRILDRSNSLTTYGQTTTPATKSQTAPAPQTPIFARPSFSRGFLTNCVTPARQRNQ